jgi:hypothetical protein
MTPQHRTPAGRSGGATPFWTAADNAELDVLVDVFVRGALDHRERCRVCASGGPWCLELREAFQIVVDWQRTRRRQSLAVWLRSRQDMLDAPFEKAA